MGTPFRDALPAHVGEFLIPFPELSNPGGRPGQAGGSPTGCSLYQIVVVQPRQKAVLVQGGPFFPEATRAVLSGSNFGGSLLKVAWVGIGLHMEFRAGDQWIITSRVQAITVQPERALPGPF